MAIGIWESGPQFTFEPPGAPYQDLGVLRRPPHGPLKAPQGLPFTVIEILKPQRPLKKNSVIN